MKVTVKLSDSYRQHNGILSAAKTQRALKLTPLTFYQPYL